MYTMYQHLSHQLHILPSGSERRDFLWYSITFIFDAIVFTILVLIAYAFALISENHPCLHLLHWDSHVFFSSSFIEDYKWYLIYFVSYELGSFFFSVCLISLFNTLWNILIFSYFQESIFIKSCVCVCTALFMRFVFCSSGLYIYSKFCCLMPFFMTVLSLSVAILWTSLHTDLKR